MKKKIIFLIGLLLFGAIIIGGIKYLLQRAPKQGNLKVDSNPVASVFLNNKHIGRTPIDATAMKVDAGEYTLKIVPESGTTQFASWQGNIKIGANLLTYIRSDLSESELSSAVDVVWLEKISGKNAEIAVTTTPDSAMVLLDDVTKGMTPITIENVVPGNHTITVSSSGFLQRTLKVQLTPGYRLVAAVKLALSSFTEDRVASVAATSEKPATASGTPKTSPKPSATGTASVVDPEKPYALIKDTPTGYLNVRMAPSKTATKTAEVKPGEKYSYEDSQKDSAGTVWYEIKKDEAVLGWVSGQYITVVE